MGWIGSALEAADIEFVDHDLPGRPYSFDHRGLVDHHHGSTGAPAGALALVINGRSDVPGPLYNVWINNEPPYDIHHISSGRTNNAGWGDPAVLAAITNDLSPTPIPKDLSSGIKVGGNGYLVGVSMYGPPHPAGQVEKMEQVNAAICSYKGWNPHTRLIDHKWWTQRKWDVTVDMGPVRTNTEELMMAQFSDQEATELRKLLTKYEDRFILGEVVDEIVKLDSSGKGLVVANLTMWREKPWLAADQALSEALTDHLSDHPAGATEQRVADMIDTHANFQHAHHGSFLRPGDAVQEVKDAL